MGMTAPIWTDWPEILQRVAEVCGAGTALRLAQHYGGREVYIPRPASIDERHHLALSLGLATARQVAEALSEGKIIIPMGPTSSPARRAQAMRRMKREGVPNQRAAKALGVHVRTIYLRHQKDRLTGASRRDEDTGDLFED